MVFGSSKNAPRFQRRRTEFPRKRSRPWFPRPRPGRSGKRGASGAGPAGRYRGARHAAVLRVRGRAAGAKADGTECGNARQDGSSSGAVSPRRKKSERIGSVEDAHDVRKASRRPPRRSCSRARAGKAFAFQHCFARVFDESAIERRVGTAAFDASRDAPASSVERAIRVLRGASFRPGDLWTPDSAAKPSA